MRQYKLKNCKRIHGLHFNPEGTRLFVVGGDEARQVDCALMLDLASGETVQRIDLIAQCYVVDLQLSRYVVGGADEWAPHQDDIAPVQWLALPDGRAWQELTKPKERGRASKFRHVMGLAFDQTGERLAICYSGARGGRRRQRPKEKLTLLEWETGTVLFHESIKEAVQVMSFNADGTRLAFTGGLDGTTVARVYDLANKRILFAFEPPATVTRAVLFLPDNRLVVANGRSLYILPSAGGEPQFTLAGHPKQVNAVTLTPDGRRLLTASHDGSIRTWDANTGVPGPRFDWGIGPVTAVSFAPDGLTCAAAGLNGKVVVWDVDE